MNKIFQIANEYYYFCEKLCAKKAFCNIIAFYILIPFSFITAFFVFGVGVYISFLSPLIVFTKTDFFVVMFLYFAVIFLFWAIYYKLEKDKLTLQELSRKYNQNFDSISEMKKFLLYELTKISSDNFMNLYYEIIKLNKEYEKIGMTNKDIFLKLTQKAKNACSGISWVISIFLTAFTGVWINKNYSIIVDFVMTMERSDFFNILLVLLILIILLIMYLELVFIYFVLTKLVVFIIDYYSVMFFNKKTTRSNYVLRYLQRDLVMLYESSFKE